MRVSTVFFLKTSKMYDIDRLNKKWQQCWKDRSIQHSREYADGTSTEISSQPEKIDRIFNLLITTYTEPDRHYHNLNHIYHVLTTIDRFAVELKNPLAVLLAAWCHDVVYDPRSADNEVQSARFATEILTDIGESIDLIDRVHQLILATAGHQIHTEDTDRCIFLDADLAILGAAPAQYQSYQRSIRREYSWVSDDAYKAGRIRVLETFLQRDRLYHTTLLFDELESIARLNMNQEIKLLIN
jgi:predicted metal-dependent HD superfamily phosphohydrolase